MSMDLNIRVISNLKDTEFFMLYQQDINLNVKNFKAGAWEKSYIAPGAQFYTVLPATLQLQGRVEGNGSVYSTKIIEAQYNHSYEIYMNSEGLDIQPSSLAAPTDNTINLYNTTDSQVDGVVLKASKPLFAANIRSTNKLNFSIKPALYVAISDYFMNQEFIDAATLSPLTKINYDGQSYLTIILGENVGNGQSSINYNFNSFDI